MYFNQSNLNFSVISLSFIGIHGKVYAYLVLRQILMCHSKNKQNDFLFLKLVSVFNCEQFYKLHISVSSSVTIQRRHKRKRLFDVQTYPRNKVKINSLGCLGLLTNH